MPSWKKVITSGSDAHLNQITASGFNLVGTGTAELEVDGHITASGNISSSGTANTFGGTSTFGGNLFIPDVIKHVGATNNSIGFTDTNTITLNTDDRIDFTAGSIILRITSDGANFNSGFLNVNNSITASGAISASGDIHRLGGKLEVTDRVMTNNLFEFTSNHGILINNNITASGNISASGQLIADSADFNDGNITNVSVIYLDSINSDANDNTTIGLTNGNEINVEVLGHQAFNITDRAINIGSDYTKGLNVNSHITASGNISSSEKIIGTRFRLPNGQFLGSANNDLLFSTGMKVSTHITASGNISASGFISTQGAITASGNISSSGNITAGGLTVAGGVDIGSNIDVDGTANLDDVDIDGTVQIDGDTTFGVNDTGVDVTFFGATSGRKMVWNQSHDELRFADNTSLAIGQGPSGDGTYDLRLYHDGTDNYINSVIGKLNITSVGGDTILQNNAPAGKISLVMDKESGGTANTGEVLISGSATPGVRLNVMGNITASGNISASGGGHVFGGSGAASLDVQGNITASGNISSSGYVQTDTIYGSGSYLTIANDTTNPSELRLNCQANSHYIGIRGPEHSGASTYVLKLPDATPADNQILKVDGSPSNGEVTLAWEADAEGGGGGVSFPTTEVISSSTNLFIGSTDAPFVSASQGNLQLSGSGTVGQLEVDHRFFDTGSSTVGSAGGAIGDVIKFGDASGLTAGKVYYLESDGTWDEVDANYGGKTSGSIAVATNAAATDGMVLRGVVKLSHDPGGNPGAPLYISAGSTGQLTSTAPGSGDFVRVVGYNLDSSGLIFFNPGDVTLKVS